MVVDDIEAWAPAIEADNFIIAKPYNSEVAQLCVSSVMVRSKLYLFKCEFAREVEEMRYKAEHDCLKDLYNRTAMETSFNRFFANNKIGNAPSRR